MATNKDCAHWRVDRVGEEDRPTLPIAWFTRRWQAEEYMQHRTAEQMLDAVRSRLSWVAQPAGAEPS